MKDYEKPVLLVNEELAEGVYAASGSSASVCWSPSEGTHQEWDGANHVFQIYVSHSDDYQHISEGFDLDITFTGAISSAYSNRGSCSVGSNSVVVSESGHGNGYKSGDNVELKVWVSTGDEATTRALAISSMKVVSCDKKVNVQGGID